MGLMLRSLLKKRRGQSTLHPLIQELSRDLREVAGMVTLPAAAYDAWRMRLLALAADDQESLAGHIVALALRLEEILPGRAEAGIIQLARLAFVLVGDAPRVTTLFAGLGVDADKVGQALRGDKRP